MANEADHAYRARLAYARSLLPNIEAALAAHAEKQAQHPRDWGWAGTMGRAGELLERVLEVLGATDVDGPTRVPPIPR